MATSLDTYAPYDSGPGSNVTEDGWRQFAQHWRGNGVIRNIGSSFAPFGDSTGLQVKVPAGECWIKGNWGQSTATKILPITTPHASLGRRDLIILRNDFAANRIEVDVLTGTPNASPLYPTLTQNTSRWEIQLGKVVVGAGVSTITAGNVTALQEYTDASCGYTVDTGYQSIATATSNYIDFDVSQFDSSGVDRPNIRQFTLTRAGMWLINFNLYWDTNATGSRAAWIQRATGSLTENSAFLGYDKKAASPDGGTAHNVTCSERFSAGETVEMWGRQQSGGTRQVLGSTSNSEGTRVSFWWLGP